MTKQCQNCNNINPDDAKFCEKCGKKLPEFSNTSNSSKNTNTRTNGKPNQVLVNTPHQIRNKPYQTRTKTQTAGKVIFGFAAGSFYNICCYSFYIHICTSNCISISNNNFYLLNLI